MNLTGWHNTEKRMNTMRRQIEAAAAICIPQSEYRFRNPHLTQHTLPKNTIEELAKLCGLPYKDGKVG